MSIFQNFSPASPSPTENEGLSSLELELENRRTRISILNQRYEKALVEMEVADRNLQLAENKKRSFRNKRKREECKGCKRKWCNTCVFNNAAKRVRVIGLDIEFNESEIIVITREIEEERDQRRAQSNAFQSVPPCPEPPFSDDDDEDDSINDNSDEVEPVKEEPDVKVEPEDDYVPNIGMVNAVKSEPMDRSNEDQNQTTEDESSEEESSMQEESQNTERTEASYRDYPSTPERSDYTTSEEDTDNESEDDNEDRRPKSILDLLK